MVGVGELRTWGLRRLFRIGILSMLIGLIVVLLAGTRCLNSLRPK
jgi:hypothetical protein